MSELIPSDGQLAVAHRACEGSLFLEGPAGAGKTTTGVLRVLHMLREGIPGRNLLVLTPQRTLATPYSDALRRPTVGPGGRVAVLTLGGLARRTIDLFWPLISGQAGFANPSLPPTFLTLETAQYFMARLVRPLLDDGYFETVVIDRNRIYSQIIDGLNKSAAVGFPHTEIGERLRDAWTGEPAQVRVYDEAQACAIAFRAYCLEHSLLDFSLQLELFVKHLWPLPLCRDYLSEAYTHLIVDNVEEDTPATHTILSEWLPRCQSALLISDWDGGFRRFLGADPESGAALGQLCDESVVLSLPMGGTPAVASFAKAMGCALGGDESEAGQPRTEHRSGRRADCAVRQSFRPALEFSSHRFFPETLDWVSERVAGLVHEQGVPPDEIVVLAPFLTDRLRFALAGRLRARAVPVRTHRPSRALREEPAARCLLTLAAISHPSWSIRPPAPDFRTALVTAIDGMDLVRAQLLADIAYRDARDGTALTSFEHMIPEAQERITFVLGRRYEELRAWIDDYAQRQLEEDGHVPLDQFLARLFTEVLSKPGYRFHRDWDAANAATTLIESARKFRWVTADAPSAGKPAGQEYLQMVEDGVIAAQYVRSWSRQVRDAVLLAPAYTFLTENRPVEVQFWLDVGGLGWWERIYQPLTHAYVLSRGWLRGAKWTDANEVETRQLALRRLAVGLARRCRQRIYLGLSELDEQGRDQRGPLLQAIQRALREDIRAEAGAGSRRP